MSNHSHLRPIEPSISTSLSPQLERRLPTSVLFYARKQNPPVHTSSSMCRRFGDAYASQPGPRSSRSRSSTASSFATTSCPSAANTSSGSTSAAAATTSSSSSWSISSRSSLHGSLPEKPHVYSLAEIAAATNNFLGKRISSSTSSWRCSIRGRDCIIFQRPFHGDPSALPARLTAVCKSHHRSLVSLLGASLSADRIYLVYEFTVGASLADCLRNPRNPNFTPLSSWISRMQVATDLAQGLQYIHHHSSGDVSVHNRIKSSAIIVTEPDFNAKICHFGTAFLAGEIPSQEDAETASPSHNKMNRLGSHRMKIEGTRGYLAPEVIYGGGVSRRSDVFAFGVVLLELISGEEPIKYRFDTVRKEYEGVSLVERARDVYGVAGLEENEPAAAEAEEDRKMRLRQWVDRRLRDSFPVEVVEKLMGVALRCVAVEAARRPIMTWVEGKVSKLFLESKAWAERVRIPTDFSVSLAPR